MTVPEIERKPITLTDTQTEQLIDAYVSLMGLHNLLMSAEAYERDNTEGKSWLNTDILHMIAKYVFRLSIEIADIVNS